MVHKLLTKMVLFHLNLRAYERSAESEIGAILLATHPRLGFKSPASIIVENSVWLIIYQFLKPKYSCKGCYNACTAESKKQAQKTKDNESTESNEVLRCPCVVEGKPCRPDICRLRCLQRNNFNRIRNRRISFSECAMDHRSIINSLTPDQMKAKYPLACIERWPKSDEHCYADEDEDENNPSRKDMVPLYKLLKESENPCTECGADGDQFFSFCMNRPVNGDRVQHCKFCGKCFYFRPGCLMGCTYCGWGEYWAGKDNAEQLAAWKHCSIEEAQILIDNAIDANGCYNAVFDIKYVPIARGCSVPPFADDSTIGLAGEGYWGY